MCWAAVSSVVVLSNAGDFVLLSRDSAQKVVLEARGKLRYAHGAIGTVN